MDRNQKEEKFSIQRPKEKILEEYIVEIGKKIEQLNQRIDFLGLRVARTPKIEEKRLVEREGFKVKDLSLADSGNLKIEWAENHMPVLMKIREEFEKTRPFEGIVIGACLHNTKETAALVRTLKAGGATVALCGSNPLSTQDDVAAALAKEGINVFSWREQTNEEYYWCINKVLDFKPNITIDDGADLISVVHSKRTELIKNIFGGQEETTTGVIRLKSMERDCALKYPIVAVNDTPTKRLFDNWWGTAQSTLDAIMRTTNVLLAGKTFVVCGYGHVGKGLAARARGMGSNVVVAEVDPLNALRAVMEGFRVMTIKEASKIGDIFVTVTGDKNVISKEHMKEMKDGTILANSGHFNVEISIPDLESISKGKRTIRPNVQEYTLNDGRRIYLLAEGRLVNLAAAEGHPSEIMDMSFSNEALACEWLVKNNEKLEPIVYDVPKEIDGRVAKLKLESMNIRIDELTEEQKKYLKSWEEGT